MRSRWSPRRRNSAACFKEDRAERPSATCTQQGSTAAGHESMARSHQSPDTSMARLIRIFSRHGVTCCCPVRYAKSRPVPIIQPTWHKPLKAKKIY